MLKAGAEWAAVRGGLIEALTLPSRVEGRIMPIDNDKQSFVYREPVGVVGVISPWNFPMHLSHRSIAPALATGNAVVVKPSEDTPVTGGLLLAKIYEEAGLPAGLLNIVIGDVAGRRRCVHAPFHSEIDFVHRIDKGWQAYRRTRDERQNAQAYWPRTWR